MWRDATRFGGVGSCGATRLVAVPLGLITAAIPSFPLSSHFAQDISVRVGSTDAPSWLCVGIIHAVSAFELDDTTYLSSCGLSSLSE